MKNLKNFNNEVKQIFNETRTKRNFFLEKYNETSLNNIEKYNILCNTLPFHEVLIKINKTTKLRKEVLKTKIMKDILLKHIWQIEYFTILQCYKKHKECFPRKKSINPKEHGYINTQMIKEKYMYIDYRNPEPYILTITKKPYNGTIKDDLEEEIQKLSTTYTKPITIEEIEKMASEMAEDLIRLENMKWGYKKEGWKLNRKWKDFYISNYLNENFIRELHF